MGPGLSYLKEPDRTKHSFDGTSSLFSFGGTDVQGWRIKMEDAHLAIANFGGDEASCLFAVFDGHGGPEVAEFAKRKFPDLLLKNPNYASGDYEKALTESFLGIDQLLFTEDGVEEIKAIQIECSKNVPKSPIDMLPDEGPDGRGCTANVILFKNGTMYIANAGDSRSVLATRGKAIELSLDHKPDDKKEKDRIEKAGGTVNNGRVEGNLNLSRALGDLKYKRNAAIKQEEQMITAMPDICKQRIGEDYDFIVMGCDGVYDTLTNQQIVDNFYKVLKEKPEKKLSEHVEEIGRAHV